MKTKNVKNGDFFVSDKMIFQRTEPQWYIQAFITGVTSAEKHHRVKERVLQGAAQSFIAVSR